MERQMIGLAIALAAVGCDRSTAETAPTATATQAAPAVVAAPVPVANPTPAASAPDVPIKHCLVSVLETPHFHIRVTENYEEGDVESDDVTYEGTSKRSGSRITLRGSTWHTHAPDGTPGRYLGYCFKNGSTSYTVSEEGELTVTDRHGRVLVEETGAWQHHPA